MAWASALGNMRTLIVLKNFMSLNTIVSIFIPYIERISNVIGTFGCYKSENNNHKILLFICNCLSISALDTYF
jgi:hypothetical protein